MINQLEEYVYSIIDFYEFSDVTFEINDDYVKGDFIKWLKDNCGMELTAKDVIFNGLRFSRQDVWASGLNDLLVNAKESIKVNDMEKALSILGLAANAVKAFRDIEIIEHTNDINKKKEILRAYILHFLAKDDRESEIIERSGIVSLVRENYRFLSTSIIDLHKNKTEICTSCEITDFLSIDLPDEIEFSIKNRVLRVLVKNTTYDQIERVAFESWILVLKAWLSYDIRFVMLDFEVPSNLYENYGDSKARSFNRFLYNVHNMLRLFPDWFFVDESKIDVMNEYMQWIESKTSLLNTYFQKGNSVQKKSKHEEEVESWLSSKSGLECIYNQFNIDSQKMYKHLELNVVLNKDDAIEPIFNCDTDMIDIVGVGNNKEKLHLINLELDNECHLSIISKILFCTMALNDAASVNGYSDSGKVKKRLFSFEKLFSKNDIPDNVVFINNKKKFRYFYSHIIAKQYHPLFDDKVIQLINSGLSSIDIVFNRHQIT